MFDLAIPIQGPANVAQLGLKRGDVDQRDAGGMPGGMPGGMGGMGGMM